MQGTETPPMSDGFTASQVHPHIYMMQPFLHSFSMHMPNGKPESSVTPGLDWVSKEAKRGSHKPYKWSYSLSWITKQELGALGSAQRDNPLCTPTQPLIVHLCLGWIHQHIIISITVSIPSRLTNSNLIVSQSSN